MRRRQRLWGQRLWLVMFCAALGSGCGPRSAKDLPLEGAGPAGSESAMVAPPSPEVLASHAGGMITLRQVEEHLRGSRRRAQADSAELLAAYRQAAETLTIEAYVASLLGDPIELLRQRDEHRQHWRQAVLELYLQEQGESETAVTEAEARAYYAANQASLRQAGERLAWHIFLRHEDSAQPEETLTLLRDLARRVGTGESFEALARQYSHSESRIKGGHLGWIGRGQVARSLEGPLFALAEGEISEPLEVPGGAMLFRVGEVRREKKHSFEDVRRHIVEILGEGRQRRRIGAAVAGIEAPEDALILDPAALRQRMQAEDGAAVVLAIGDFQLTVADFVQRLVDATAGLGLNASGTDPAGHGGVAFNERLVEIYQEQVDTALLLGRLVASGWVEKGGRGAAIRHRLASQGRSVLIEEWLAERMRQQLALRQDALRSFHADNRYLYQSPLRFKLQTLSIPAPAGGAASAKMAEMESLVERLRAGETTFAATAELLSTEVVDLGWLDFQHLTSLAANARDHVLGLDGVGYTLPFHQQGGLHLAWVEEREEPTPLNFEGAAHRVREDYYERHQQSLYSAVAAELLSAQDFHFFADNLRLALGLSAAAGPEESPTPPATEEAE